ncbi:MAG TPA: hypothetical protein VGG23_07710, partial [Acidimicrobiales bacterium]
MPAPVTLTVTSTEPAAPTGDVAVSSVGEVTVTSVAGVVPKSTVVDPSTKPVPSTVTEVPPATGPMSGVTDVTVGSGGGSEAAGDPLARTNQAKGKSTSAE